MPTARRSPCPPKLRALRGLTMVEAMCMLLAVGLVAALALPKMAEQQSRSRVAQLRQAAQGLQARLDRMRDRALARGFDCQDTEPRPLQLDGENVVLRHCQPQADPGFGQDLLATLPPGVGHQWQLAPLPLTAPHLALERADAPQPAQCALRYTGATAGQPSRVDLSTSGC